MFQPRLTEIRVFVPAGPPGAPVCGSDSALLPSRVVPVRTGPSRTCSAPWKQILQLGVGMHVSLLLFECIACGLLPPAAASCPPHVSPQLGPSSPGRGRPWGASSQVWRRPAAAGPASTASVLMVKCQVETQVHRRSRYSGLPPHPPPPAPRSCSRRFRRSWKRKCRCGAAHQRAGASRGCRPSLTVQGSISGEAPRALPPPPAAAPAAPAAPRCCSAGLSSALVGLEAPVRPADESPSFRKQKLRFLQQRTNQSLHDLINMAELIS